MNPFRIAFVACAGIGSLVACAGSGIVEVPSRNHNSRVNYLVIHHTSENFAESLRILTESVENPVSAHYLVPDAGDPTYEARKLRVYRLVPESRRAWHAGVSYWAGEEALNDRSIGIEIVNQAHCIDRDPEDERITLDDMLCFFPGFSDEQVTLLIDLIHDVLERYPEIDPIDIVGHSDIAPDRKVDPGPRFPWQRLYRHGIGTWYDDDTMLTYRRRFRESMPPTATLQLALHHYGYRVEQTGVIDEQTRYVLRAFQMRFRPSAVTTYPDAETAAILFALIDKYRPDALAEIDRSRPDAALQH